MELLKKLCETHGISGREEAVRAVIREEMKDRVDKVSVDALGSITCFRKGSGHGRLLRREGIRRPRRRRRDLRSGQGTEKPQGRHLRRRLGPGGGRPLRRPCVRFRHPAGHRRRRRYHSRLRHARIERAPAHHDTRRRGGDQDHGFVADLQPQAGRFFHRYRKKNRIRYQMEILRRGGTDAGAMQRVHSGCPAITISIPTRYGHSPIEMVHKKDVNAAIRLITKFLEAAHKGDFMPH